MAGWKPGAFRDAAQELGFQELVRQPPGPTQALERMTELSRLSGESRGARTGATSFDSISLSTLFYFSLAKFTIPAAPSLSIDE